MASVEEKKAEALERMRLLGYWGRAKEAFRRGNKVFVNEPPFGAVYDLEPDLAAAVKEFERKNNALVYMVVRSVAEFGRMDSYLYIGDDETEWKYEKQDIRDGIVFTYTVNYDAPDCSEFGSIMVRLGAGAGLVRVA